MIGSSYEGFTVVMALIHPHPALKVAAPESPMVDGWMGDDWFHYGAFRQNNLDYFTDQTTVRGGHAHTSRRADDYTNYLRKDRLGILRARVDWINCLSGDAWRRIRLTMNSGRGRRSTKSWPRRR